MNLCIRWCWLVGVILSVIACAGSKQGRVPSRTTPPVRPLPSTDREKLAADQRAPEESMAEEDDPRRILERAQRQYDLARAAAERKDIGAARTAIDEALRLMVAISAVEDSDLALPKESLLKQLSKLIVAIHEGRIGGGTKGVIAFTFNNRVEREIKRFTGRERRGLVEAYARSGLYRTVIERELAARGLPDALLWLPVVESGFTPKARSQAQAVGLRQVIRATGQRYGLKRDAWTDDRMNPD
ncbi:MAG: transglycosylase SLT domain-containing protein, partial [Candidatus Latescibacteria bacterium]|nr:transglycosylase SLT domain-containing protein [Candidatus Latescibacterota bacterium]